MSTRITYTHSRGEFIIQLVIDESDYAAINFNAYGGLAISTQLHRLGDLIEQIEQARDEEQNMIRDLINQEELDDEGPDESQDEEPEEDEEDERENDDPDLTDDDYIPEDDEDSSPEEEEE